MARRYANEATPRQKSYLSDLLDKLEAQGKQLRDMESFDLVMSLHRKKDEYSKAIDEAKALLAAPVAAPITNYTPAEDAAIQPSVNERRYTGETAKWYYTRNGGGRDELDNQ